MLDTKKKVPVLEKIFVVKDFLDVVPEELLGLPSGKENEFGIDVPPRTQPISIPSYHMAPLELRELKIQL